MMTSAITENLVNAPYSCNPRRELFYFDSIHPNRIAVRAQSADHQSLWFGHRQRQRQATTPLVFTGIFYFPACKFFFRLFAQNH
jgi:hypothetical protein